MTFTFLSAESVALTVQQSSHLYEVAIPLYSEILEASVSGRVSHRHSSYYRLLLVVKGSRLHQERVTALLDPVYSLLVRVDEHLWIR